MKRTFTSQLAFALIAAVVSALLMPALTLVVGSQNAVFAITGVAATAYALWIMGPNRTGLVTVTLVAAALAAYGALFYVSLVSWVICLALMIWLARSLVSYRSVACALADLALTGLALVTALWAVVQTHTLGWPTWTFFLVSAFSALIPTTLASAANRAPPARSDDAFTRAQAAAQAALDRLQSTRSTVR